MRREKPACHGVDAKRLLRREKYCYLSPMSLVSALDAPERFPEHFMFQLTNQEWKNLRSQFATSSFHGGRRYMPYVFTEHGVLMAANVLNSGNAIKTSVALVDAFVKLRRMALSVDGLARKLNTLESKYDKQFSAIFTAIRQLMSAPPAGKKIKGFKKD